MTTERFHNGIVLTGGIASGKSSAAVLFLELGISLIDADKIAHTVLEAQSGKIAEMFGAEYVREGEVDRKALGRLVFGNVQERRRLEALVHPLIYDEIMKQAAALEQEGKPYLVDIPLFFETKRYPFEKVLVVYVPQSLQLSRLMARDGSTEEEALLRIDAQISIEEKKAQATYLLDNSGGQTALQREVTRVMKEIEGDSH